MKKIFLFIACLIAVSFAAIQFIALPKAKNNIKNYFASIGFKHTKINEIALSIDGLRIQDLTLDKDRFNTASNIKAEIFWPSYIFNASIKSIHIETLKISSVINSPKDMLTYKHFFNSDKINGLSAQNLKIDNIVWDIATPQNALRLEGGFNLEQKDDTKKITATLNAAQHELTLNSRWAGSIAKDKSITIEGAYDGLSINTNTLKLNRATGWTTLSAGGETKDMAAQLNAGSGRLFNVPVKNISLILSQNEDSYPVSLRASASGLNNVNLYGDFRFANNIEKQAFEILLDIKNPKEFVNYLTQQRLIKNSNPVKTHPTTKTSIRLAYEPKNRFADGPFPFSLSVAENNSKNLKGTFLIYPNNLDVRGTAQGSKNSIHLLKTLLSIKEKNVSDKNIRLDTNLKNLF